jgi:hypothetical protein
MFAVMCEQMQIKKKNKKKKYVHILNKRDINAI